jgi:hypothetical protein
VQQSTILVGALLAAFIFWLAIHNRLGVYWGIIGGRGAGSAPSAPSMNPASPNFNPAESANRFGCYLRQMFGGSPCQ